MQQAAGYNGSRTVFSFSIKNFHDRIKTNGQLHEKNW